MGRLVRDPEARYSQGTESTTIARYTLAVDRKVRTNNQDSVDFIPCVAFGRAADFAEKYLHKGTKIVITGRIQTGSYTNKDGVRAYTTDVVVEDQEFAESKATNGSSQGTSGSSNGYRTGANDFIDMDSIDEEIPFN